ncbi:unnamed protein product [Tilletia controversa]|uniref:Amidase domain-containing protein n=3 Tax=Tilletia TaxID=13289 RepID=A0ABN7IZR9_9BASI|nr:hypothetical protein CF335_g3120 [Tilletia laevis]CAD6925159.1 unnamed protein product [Tilletia controversa]CAD6942023.1 unnamed protein product [Tilletia caries]
MKGAVPVMFISQGKVGDTSAPWHPANTKRRTHLLSWVAAAVFTLTSLSLLLILIDVLPAESQPALLSNTLCSVTTPFAIVFANFTPVGFLRSQLFGQPIPDPRSNAGPASLWSASGIGCHSPLGKTQRRTLWRLPEERLRDADHHLPDLLTATLDQLQQGLDQGHFTSVHLVKAYLARIDEVNRQGPELNAVIETAPRDYLLAEAARRDDERARGLKRGYLHGIPILVKDNFATNASMFMNTTAGSYALLGAISPRNARIITDAVDRGGAIILGKTNMSVWAQFHGFMDAQGWSPRGGYTTSAYYPGGNTCGSSSGSAVAASIGLAGATLGTETDGSIVCPASSNALVGFKPTVGLVSRAGAIPVSSTQDSPGPIVQTVADAARVLTDVATLGGYDGRDEATRHRPRHARRGVDYVHAIQRRGGIRALQGVRIGVLADEYLNATLGEFDPAVLPLYQAAIQTLRQAGAVIVDAVIPTTTDWFKLADDAEHAVAATEFKVGLNAYLAELEHIPSAVFDMAGLVYFEAVSNSKLERGNRTEQGRIDLGHQEGALQTRMWAPGQVGTKLNETYERGLNTTRMLSSGIDAALREHHVQALVAPTDTFFLSLAAVGRHPAVSVPMGFMAENTTSQEGVFPPWPFPHAPAGLCFVAEHWAEEKLLAFAYAFEHATGHIRRARKPFDAAIPKTQLRDVM